MGRNGTSCNSSKGHRPYLRCATFLFWSLSMLVLSSHANAEELIDRLVAEVNGEIITYSDIQDKIARGHLVEVTPFPAKSSDAPFEIALQDAINKTLLSQKVEEAGLEVTDQDVESEIHHLMEKRGISKDQLLQALSAEGLSYEQYSEDFRNKLLLTKFQGRFILPNIKISEKDIELHYFKKIGVSPSGLKLKLRQIFVSLSEDATNAVRDEKNRLLKTILEKLEGGMPFDQAAKIYSDAPGASDNGGDIGALLVNQMAPMFKEPLERLEPQSYTKPIEATNGFYLFFLEKKMISDSSDFDRRKDEIRYDLRRVQMETETIHWIESQRNQAKILVVR